MTPRLSRTLLVMSTLLLFVLVITGCSDSGKGKTPQKTNETSADQPVRIEDLRNTYPHLGNPDAQNKILLFADFKCPHCKTFDEEIFPKLLSTYVDTGKAELFYIPLPVLGGDAYTAAQAALAVHDEDPGAFWAYAQTLFAHQESPSKGWATPVRLIELGESIQPPVERTTIEQGLKSDAIREAIDQGKMIAEHYGLSAVPSLVINDRLLTNAHGEPDAFDWQAIEKALK
ncbi:MAG: thioredoxin domain-containing protein [Candidatus Carbobacillus altaicus]|nr:thioredoxin domain-containing protein [Candidatus Carbobacillus altaicus]